MHFRLIGVGNTFTFELSGSSPLSVGRAVTNDCAIVDPTISRKHADLKVTPGGVEVIDQGSSNGTFVNGVQIEHSLIVPGDEVTFGKVVFRLEQVTPVRPAAVPAPAMGTSTPRAGATIVRQIPKTGESLALQGVAKMGEQLGAAADPGEKDRRRLAILLEVSKGLTRSADIEALLQKIAEYAFQVLEQTAARSSSPTTSASCIRRSRATGAANVRRATSRSRSRAPRWTTRSPCSPTTPARTSASPASR